MNFIHFSEPSCPSVMTANDVLRLTGPLCFTSCIETYLSRVAPDANDVLVLPSYVAHAVPNHERVDLSDQTACELLKLKFITPRSLVVHWWQRSWQQSLAP